MKCFRRLFSFVLPLLALGLILIPDSSSRFVDAKRVSDFSEIESIRMEPSGLDEMEISSSYLAGPARYYGDRSVNYYADSSDGYGGGYSNAISIAGRYLPVVDVASTLEDSYNHVNRVGGLFYYGHNTGAVFGGIVYLGVGDAFSIDYGGVRHNFRISKTMIFEKNVEKGLLQLGGYGNYMKSVSLARYDGVQYSVALMTCYGESYGNGDASHRFVIFADEY